MQGIRAFSNRPRHLLVDKGELRDAWRSAWLSWPALATPHDNKSAFAPLSIFNALIECVRRLATKRAVVDLRARHRQLVSLGFVFGALDIGDGTAAQVKSSAMPGSLLCIAR